MLWLAASLWPDQALAAPQLPAGMAATRRHVVCYFPLGLLELLSGTHVS